jgi:hypothetical protein
LNLDLTLVQTNQRLGPGIEAVGSGIGKVYHERYAHYGSVTPPTMITNAHCRTMVRYKQWMSARSTTRLTTAANSPLSQVSLDAGRTDIPFMLQILGGLRA